MAPLPASHVNSKPALCGLAAACLLAFSLLLAGCATFKFPPIKVCAKGGAGGIEGEVCYDGKTITATVDARGQREF